MRREYVHAVRERYRRGGKREKQRILDELCATCGYERKSAIRALNRRAGRPRLKPGRPSRYEEAEIGVLQAIWLKTERMGSKRLKAALPLWLPHYEARWGELEEAVRERLLTMSPATMDRLLSAARSKAKPRGLCGTKPGTLLRNEIPIRTSNGDITKPGFLEADTVAHCGNSLAGDFIWSLTFTDIYSGWTENRATWNRGAEGVVAQVRDVEACLAFPVLGFDCDNGSEFLNYHLLRYLQERPHPVRFTRGRPYHSNDNAHVEQKHWTHVRQTLGYARFSNPDLVDPINDLYANECSRLRNFFCPTFKLESKEKSNAKRRKRHSAPQTPYQRLLDSPDVAEEEKERLRATFATLDPFALAEAMHRKVKAILRLQADSRR